MALLGERNSWPCHMPGKHDSPTNYMPFRDQSSPLLWISRIFAVIFSTLDLAACKDRSLWGACDDELIYGVAVLWILGTHSYWTMGTFCERVRCFVAIDDDGLAVDCWETARSGLLEGNILR